MNNTRTVNNSSLPRIIPNIIIVFDPVLMFAKLPCGPITEPRPGPTFPRDAEAPLILETKSRPIAERAEAIKTIDKQ